jgi:hypothetical protein
MPLQMIETTLRQGDIIWLLYSTGTLRPKGKLCTLDLSTGARTEVLLPSAGPVEQFVPEGDGSILICTSSRELWQYSNGKAAVLASLPESPLPALFRKYHLDQHSTLKQVFDSGMVRGRGCPLFGDRILGMFAKDRDILILTSCSVLTWDHASGTWDVMPLPNLIPKAMRMPGVLAGDRCIYLGMCLGEDGGDLMRIDTRTGAVDILYEGTQVTAVVRDPGNSPTVLYSTGTWHMGLNRGGFFRVGEQSGPLISGKAVYDAASYQGDIVAATRDGVHRISSGTTERYDYPEHVLYDGIGVVSDERFGTFVLTDLYRTCMVCGSVPLFAERNV